jgi:hypothetical protein
MTPTSAWYGGTCNAYSLPAGYAVYSIVSVTPPTLPSGPYHLELR